MTTRGPSGSAGGSKKHPKVTGGKILAAHPPVDPARAPRADFMKHNHKHDNSTEPHLIPVHFEFTSPTATTVCIAGAFNHWNPDTKPMHLSADGHWWKESYMSPGSYEYCLVVDGRWIPDPLARESVPNPFGGRNSVLTVATSPMAGHLADAEKVPMQSTI